jgi:hypothetical protein
MLALSPPSPVRVYRDAIISCDSEGVPRVQGHFRERAVPDDAVSQISLVIRDKLMFHYFHFLEMFLCIYSAQRYWAPNAKVMRFYIGSQILNNPAHDDIQSKIMRTIYPDAEIVTGEHDNAPEKFTILVDRKLSRSYINKMIDPVQNLVSRYGRDFRNTIIQKLCGAQDQAPPVSGKRKALYVHRDPPRYLEPIAERMLFDRLEKFFTIDVIDFAKIPWEEQVRAVQDIDLLFGAHGNGFSNLLWVNDRTKILEIFPAGVHHYDYQLLCEIAGLEYWAIEGRSVFREFSRHGPAYGHMDEANKPISELDSRIVEMVTSTVGRIGWATRS